MRGKGAGIVLVGFALACSILAFAAYRATNHGPIICPATGKPSPFLQSWMPTIVSRNIIGNAVYIDLGDRSGVESGRDAEETAVYLAAVARKMFPNATTYTVRWYYGPMQPVYYELTYNRAEGNLTLRNRNTNSDDPQWKIDTSRSGVTDSTIQKMARNKDPNLVYVTGG